MLRPYQSEMKTKILDAWATGAKCVLAVLPTGSGKTVLFADIVRQHSGPCCVVAHRQELVTQISMALAREGVRHRIIGPPPVVRLAVSLHCDELKTSYYDPSAPVAVAGVDTLIRRVDRWRDTVTLWVMDEAHHVLRANKWGSAVAMFPRAKGLGVTATPLRGDGNGLGAHAQGVFDRLVVGPGMRDLIQARYLSEYRIFAPPCDLDLSDVTTSSGGDYSPVKLRRAVHRSRVVGDVVTHYNSIAPGKLGVTFASDVETATGIAERFVASGVPAEVVTADTPTPDRVAAIRRFRNRVTMQLVNVDLFGEGFDLPAIECVSFARPTQSYGLYVQQFGRSLRPLDGKNSAIIIDHVGNVVRHGLPDRVRAWSLDSRERRTIERDTVDAVRVCPECTGVYDRVLVSCPYCGHAPIPSQRGGPEYVDGDLCELDAATLDRMRGDIARVNMPAEAYRAELVAKHAPQIAQRAHVNRHVRRQEAQHVLRTAIQWWAGVQAHRGRTTREGYRRFFLSFGIDVLSAQALGEADALALADRVTHHMGEELCRT